MKTKLLFIALIAMSFASCKKCATCTRTWSNRSYELAPDGSHINETFVAQSSVETFDVCETNDIRNAEQPIVNTQTNVLNGQTFVTVTTGTCNCVTK